MSLIEDFRDNFGEQFRNIMNSNYPSLVVTDEDIRNCFESIMIDDQFDVGDVIADAISTWIENEKGDEIEEVDRKEELQEQIASAESELSDLKRELFDLQNVSSRSSSSSPKNETWSDNDKW